jgi:hypothetical protein
MTDRVQSWLKFLFVIMMILVLAVGCTAKPTPPASSIDLVPFQEMARTAQCAEEVNNLFLVDDSIVFWEIRGFCADASYSYMLFGSDPDALLCRYSDSIAGPQKDCPDTSYQALFDTILEHSEDADLGLGSEHTVQPVPF